MPKSDLERRLIHEMIQLEREVDKLDRKKAEIEGKLEKLRGLQTALQELTPDLLSLLLDEATHGESAGAEPQGTHFERIAKFLQEHAEEPQTIAAIEEGTGIPRASISAVLYRTHPDEFISYDMEERPGRGRAKMWRLRGQAGERGENVPPYGEGFEEPDPFDDSSKPDDDIPF